MEYVKLVLALAMLGLVVIVGTRVTSRVTQAVL